MAVAGRARIAATAAFQLLKSITSCCQATAAAVATLTAVRIPLLP